MSSEYRVLDASAPMRASDPLIAKLTRTMLDQIKSQEPHRTGALAAGWSMTKKADAEYELNNSVRYARYVEFGTRYMRARPVVGQALAQARAAT